MAHSFLCCVVEVRGGPRNNKVSLCSAFPIMCAFAQVEIHLRYDTQVVSSTKKVSDGLLEWNETLKL